MIREKEWYRLDNAALIFPPVSGKNTPNTFCISATLDKKIDKEVLKKSVNQALKNEDTFKVRLKKGLFWYYLERNDKDAEVYDDGNFMEFINYKRGDEYLFKVFAGENVIRITFFHVLTDGAGGLYFFKQVLYQYLKNCGEKIDTNGLVKPIEFSMTKEEIDDKFLEIKPAQKEKKIPEQKALKLTGKPFKEFGTGIITAECKIEEIKKLSKANNTTITGYLCALYMMSIYESYIKNKKTKTKMVCISIPVNIRKKHPTETKRNFTLVIRVCHDFNEKITFENLVKKCDYQLKTKLTTEQIDEQIRFNAGAEKNILMRIVPRFLKSMVLKIAYNLRSTKEETTNLSNLGIVEIPKEMEKHILDLNFILQASKHTQKNLSVISLGERLFISFSRRHVENKTEQYFLKTLAENGVKLTVRSNYQEMNKNENM